MAAKHTGSSVSLGEMTTSHDTVIESLAALLRRLFVVAYRSAKYNADGRESDWGSRHMPRWDGGDDDNGTYTAIWPKAAKLCLAEQMDPGTFVSAQFAAGRGSIPSPAHLTGPNAVARYVRVSASVPLTLRQALASQMSLLKEETAWRQLQREVSQHVAARSVLCDRNLDLSGLFRYVIAVKAGQVDIADRYRDAALQQYVLQREAYDQTWASMIPEDLRNYACEFIKSIV